MTNRQNAEIKNHKIYISTGVMKQLYKHNNLYFYRFFCGAGVEQQIFLPLFYCQNEDNSCFQHNIFDTIILFFIINVPLRRNNK